MYTRSARIPVSDTHFAILLRSDTDFGLMHTRSARILVQTHTSSFCVGSDTAWGLMYIHSDRCALRQPSLLVCYVLTQFSV